MFAQFRGMNRSDHLWDYGFHVRHSRTGPSPLTKRTHHAGQMAHWRLLLIVSENLCKGFRPFQSTWNASREVRFASAFSALGPVEDHPRRKKPTHTHLPRCYFFYGLPVQKPSHNLETISFIFFQQFSFSATFLDFGASNR